MLSHQLEVVAKLVAELVYSVLLDLNDEAVITRLVLRRDYQVIVLRDENLYVVLSVS